MDSPALRKRINEYLYVDFDQSEPDWEKEKISEDWPYKLEYKGNWSIPNDNDPNDTVDIYFTKAYPDLYAYATKHAVGADEVESRPIEEYIKSEWDVEPKRLDEEK